MTENTREEYHVTADNIEPDESQTPAEFAGEEWLTLEQVAKYYDCSIVQVREFIDQGLLTPVSSGSIQRIARSELEKIGNPIEKAAREFEAGHNV